MGGRWVAVREASKGRSLCWFRLGVVAGPLLLIWSAQVLVWRVRIHGPSIEIDLFVEL